MSAYLMRQLTARIVSTTPQELAVCTYTIPDDDLEGLAELREMALQELLLNWPCITEAQELDEFPDGSWSHTGVKWTKEGGWEGV